MFSCATEVGIEPTRTMYKDTATDLVRGIGGPPLVVPTRTTLIGTSEKVLI